MNIHWIKHPFSPPSIPKQKNNTKKIICNITPKKLVFK